MPKSNPTRKAKRAKTYKAFLASAAWKRIRKAAVDRAGHQCEARTKVVTPFGDLDMRCTAMEALTVHHVRYGWRFGGNELPEDLQVLCKSCHNALHAKQGKRIA